MKIIKAFTYFLNAIIAFYLAVIFWFIVFGGYDGHILGLRVKLVDLNNPALILLSAICLRLMLSAATNRKVLFAIVTVIFSSFMILGAGEMILRIFFHTSWEYIPLSKNSLAKNPLSERGPVIANMTKTGKTRILVQGDSITWGQGVPQWTDLYPYRLLQSLNSDGERYEMTTLAAPGKETDWHAANLKLFGDKIDPDIIIYQWYINDVEVKNNRRPPPAPPWRSLPFHLDLTNSSFLYFLVDQRLERIVIGSGKLYADYINEDFKEGSIYWQAFRDAFHQWATRARSMADRVVIAFYPAVPFSGEYPLKEITDRVKRLTKPNIYTIPAHSMPKIVGENVVDENSRMGIVRKAISGKTPSGTLAFGPYTVLGKGKYRITFRIKSSFTGEGDIAIIDVASDIGKTTHARKALGAKDFAGEKGWKDFVLEFEVKKKLIEKVEFRVQYTGAGDLSLDTIEFPVDYNLEVVDFLPYLTGFDTHATLFDAHPNARAHAVMADVLYKKIKQSH